MVTKQFREWACSLSGCDNNNLDADVWLSGIEYGIKKDDQEEYYNGRLQKEIANGACVPNQTYDWKGGLTYPYGNSMAKLLCAYNGGHVDDSVKYSNRCDGSEVFKMNLYPIAFNGTTHKLWDEHDLKSITNLETKHQYIAWCFLNRFPCFADLVAEKKPRIIIGTGIGCLTDFFTCYGGVSKDKYQSIRTGVLENKSATKQNSSVRRYYWGKLNEKTTLVVIPFLARRYGLNSDALRQEMGDTLRSLVNRN